MLYIISNQHDNMLKLCNFNTASSTSNCDLVNKDTYWWAALSSTEVR